MQRDALKSPWCPELSQDPAQKALKVLRCLRGQPLTFLAHGFFPPLRTELGMIHMPGQAPFMMP